MDWINISAGILIGAILGIAGTFFLLGQRITKLETQIAYLSEKTPVEGETPTPALRENGKSRVRNNTKSDTLPEEKTLHLSPAGPRGKTVPGSSGELRYYDNHKGAFGGTIELRGLEPNVQYILTINGKPTHPSNALIPGKTLGAEKYYDFSPIKTDDNGSAVEHFKLHVLTGHYDVKFFVKDMNDWTIVLFNDFLAFTVQ